MLMMMMRLISLKDEEDDADDEDEQGWIKCCSAVATLRAEQGPCEPSKGFVSKFGEP